MKTLILIVILGVTLAGPVAADPFADAVTEITYGPNAGQGQNQFPGIVLGPPRGGGLAGGSMDVLSLGDGGSITLSFTDNIVANGPGPDLIVFENAFFIGQNPLDTYCEVGFVEVSQDGISFVRFPNDYDPEGTPVNNPANWQGFAGVMPCLSHPDNGIDPTDPDLAGGDVFDLDDVGLDWIQYIRIIDTNEPPNAAADDDGDEIYDYGWTSAGTAGFDLDAVAAIYSTPVTTPTPEATGTPAATETPVSSATPTPTPPPVAFTLELSLSESMPAAGDPFQLNLTAFQPTPQSVTFATYVILDVDAVYYFWPEWNRAVSFEPVEYAHGVTSLTLLDFTWPDVPDHHPGLRFWAACLDADGTLASNIHTVEFSF